MNTFYPRAGADHDACGVGFVARLGGAASREVLDHALTALGRLAHRGGVDADGLSGDGAGLLLPIPKDFFRARAAEAGIELPEEFGLGHVFIEPGQAEAARECIESRAREHGLQCLWWREIPTDPSHLGPRATATLPVIQQCFFGLQDAGGDLERALFLLRKQVETQAPCGIYFCSLSSRSVCYKGLLAPQQLQQF